MKVRDHFYANFYFPLLLSSFQYYPPLWLYLFKVVSVSDVGMKLLYAFIFFPTSATHTAQLALLYFIMHVIF
jgi:hypothetical protein